MAQESEHLTDFWSRVSPRRWTIAFKLALLLVVSALTPMMLTAYYNYQGSYRHVRSLELKNIEHSASTIADRIRQRIQDTKHIIKLLASDEDTIQFVTHPTTELRRKLNGKMKRVLETNEHFELLMIMDQGGNVLASTRESTAIGRNLKWRDYFKMAIQGSSYVSSIEIGSTSGKPGIYFSSPIKNVSGAISGVAVFKLDGNAIASIAGKHQHEGKGQSVFVVDKNGVIIIHTEKKLLYHSLNTIPPDVMQTVLSEKRFMTDQIPSLNLPLLAKTMIGAKAPGHLSYRSDNTDLDKVLGFAPVAGSQRWVVGVSEPQELFLAPLNWLLRNVIVSVTFVGLAFVFIAMFFAQNFTRPIRAISDSTEKLKRGDFDNAHAKVFNNDEIGQLAVAFNVMVQNMKEREREKDIFGRVVSPEVREKLLAGDLALGGEHRRVTVLFSDIRSFTTMSEELDPDDVVLMLNEYLTEMSAAVRPFGGYINNFIGDAIVVIFGAPVARECSEYAAIQAAMAMLERLKALNERRIAMSNKPLAIGIGISTGKAVAGQIGSPERFLYTVIGDAVNIAARLESLTKEYPDCPILFNKDTYEAVKDKPDISIVSLGNQQLKGRIMPVAVYGVSVGDRQD